MAQDKALALLSTTMASWRNLTRQSILQREGKLAILRGNFGEHSLRACMDTWKVRMEDNLDRAASRTLTNVTTLLRLASPVKQ